MPKFELKRHHDFFACIPLVNLAQGLDLMIFSFFSPF